MYRSPNRRAESQVRGISGHGDDAIDRRSTPMLTCVRRTMLRDADPPGKRTRPEVSSSSPCQGRYRRRTENARPRWPRVARGLEGRRRCCSGRPRGRPPARYAVRGGGHSRAGSRRCHRRRRRFPRGPRRLHPAAVAPVVGILAAGHSLFLLGWAIITAVMASTAVDLAHPASPSGHLLMTTADPARLVRGAA
jgi:hypothetical protein